MFDGFLRYLYSMLAGMLPKDLIYMCAIRVYLAASDRGEVDPEMDERLRITIGRWVTHYRSIYPAKE